MITMIPFKEVILAQLILSNLRELLNFNSLVNLKFLIHPRKNLGFPKKYNYLIKNRTTYNSKINNYLTQIRIWPIAISQSIAVYLRKRKLYFARRDKKRYWEREWIHVYPSLKNVNKAVEKVVGQLELIFWGRKKLDINRVPL